MPRESKNKLKILLLLNYLEKNTDENHGASTREIISFLESEEISCNRKTLYSDMMMLQEAGFDIRYQKEGLEGWMLCSRNFEIAELKLLVDAVSSSKFISEKKTRTIIDKLENLCSKYEAKDLRRDLIAAKTKSDNEQILYSVDSIHRAIAQNNKIEFDYFGWGTDRSLVSRGYRCVSPWALIWDDENYYLLACDDKDHIFKHFRVDKMRNVLLTDKTREGSKEFAKKDMKAYSNETFGMYGGEAKLVILRFRNDLIGVAIDRFGKDALIRADGEDYFRIRVKVVVSQQFFGWLTGIGPGVTIVDSPEVSLEYKNYLEDILKGI